MKERAFTKGDKVQSTKMGHAFGLTGEVIRYMPGLRYLVRLDECQGLRMIMRGEWLKGVDHASQ